MVPEDEESPCSPGATPHSRENTHSLAVFQQPNFGRLECHDEEGPGYRLTSSAARKDELLLAAGSQGHLGDQGSREGSLGDASSTATCLESRACHETGARQSEVAD